VLKQITIQKNSMANSVIGQMNMMAMMSMMMQSFTVTDKPIK